MTSTSGEHLPSVCVPVPTWNREHMLHACLKSLINQTYKGMIKIVVIDDASTDLTISMVHDLQLEIRDRSKREIELKAGPGRSNWRPGAIHYPIFQNWLETKCDLITYQFSDEISHADRFRAQIANMHAQHKSWSFCSNVSVINEQGQQVGTNNYRWTRNQIGSNFLMAPSIIANKVDFERCGGLDFPLHAAAKAEEWVTTHVGLMGEPFICDLEGAYQFRVHQDSLGHGHRPGSDLYKKMIDATGFVEEDHWRLWNRASELARYDERVERARRM